eukprot:scaffold9569_cov142-Isochrysis_galbana.AAC.10
MGDGQVGAPSLGLTCSSCLSDAEGMTPSLTNSLTSSATISFLSATVSAMGASSTARVGLGRRVSSGADSAAGGGSWYVYRHMRDPRKGVRLETVSCDAQPT